MTAADEPINAQILSAVTRVEMEIGFMRKERAADQAAAAKAEADQDEINRDVEGRLRDLKNNQEQRKGISSMAALLVGTVGGAVVSFALAQWVAHPTSAPSQSPQIQTNCGTFIVVGSACPAVSSSKSPSGTTSKSSDTTGSTGRGQTLVAIHQPIPQQPFPRVSVGQQKAVTNPKVQAKKPLKAAAKRKGHKK